MTNCDTEIPAFSALGLQLSIFSIEGRHIWIDFALIVSVLPLFCLAMNE